MRMAVRMAVVRGSGPLREACRAGSLPARRVVISLLEYAEAFAFAFAFAFVAVGVSLTVPTVLSV